MSDHDPNETPFSAAMESLSAAMAKLIDQLSKTQQSPPACAETLRDIAGAIAALDRQQRRRRSTKPVDRVAVLKALVSIRGAQAITKVYHRKENAR